MARLAEGGYDLHLHSTFSDGSETVGRLVSLARACGLARIAVTDHDCLAQLSAVRDCARDLGFPVLAGVEVSAKDPGTGRKVHILGYGLEATPDADGPLELLVAETLRDRCANTLWQAWAIARAGVEFKGRCLGVDATVQAAGASTGVYKQHIMQALTQLPYNDPDYQQLYRSLFKGSGVASRDIDYPSATDAVRAVREQGGTAVLAHPGQTDSWSYVPELVAAGLQGIEAFHPDHTFDDVERAFEASREFGLFVTGGSDYHGRYGAPERPGVCFVMPEEAGERVDALFAAETSLA